MTKNIAFQSRFVNPRREINHREFNEFLDRLDLIDQLLKCSGFELKFAQTYLDGLEALCGHPLDPKSVRRHTEYAVQALRCNILKMLLRQSLRQTSLLIAASPEFQTLDLWCHAATCSRIEPMKDIAKMLITHRPLILNYFRAKKQFNSGIVEGLNRKINLTIRKSFGFRTLKIAKICLYHQLGELPEPEFAHKFW